ncbi:MAG: FGGY family carbohydrate kinase [Lachnospiraceae bacterium]|nr:FGGY family carbohydrate kinase [Lachnospiraceae bacterium]
MLKLTEKYVIGMDCGTSNIKAVVLAETGVVVAEESRASTTIRVGSCGMEQDADEWWKNAVEIFQSLKVKAGEAVFNSLCGLAISSHTVTMLALDEDRKPLRNALTCQDGRSGNEMRRILNCMGKQHFVETVGGQPAVAFLPNKIEWFRTHEPELFAKTRYYLQASSYLNMKLTGVMVTDLDQASRTQCLDINTMTWSREIGDLIGVDLNAVMPELRAVDDIIGAVTQEASILTGLPCGLPVTAGCSDALASMYAMGLSKLGDAGESAGTTSLVFAGTTKKSASDIPVVTKPCRIEGMPWIFDAPIQSTGASIRWFIENMGAEERAAAKAQGMDIYSYLNQIALESVPGANGLIFYPYLLGERAPLWNEYARGMFIGIGMDTRRCDFVRALFEGTAFALRQVIETIKASGAKVEVLRICGGGAKSRTWCRIKASMLHIPVALLDDRSGDVPVGDALLAGHKVGVFPDLAQAVEKIVKVKEVIRPDEEWAAAYDKLYPYYIEMYQKLDSSLKNIREAANDIAAAMTN